MKYLGLVLDERWTFKTHFSQLAPKLMSTATALRRLLPNVGGPGSIRRRLSSGIIRSMALYGSPICVEALTAQLKPFLRRPQMVIPVRAIRGYRTVSWTVATLLAGAPRGLTVVNFRRKCSRKYTVLYNHAKQRGKP
ncbi:uncharacterized protein LOC113231909 [Hyposmocoma kahamanoa]|uniref:uncharacterized protein LOC113231909 n=1 Tax=Hyposmocoma kahamanoa TaxID=1477025 RepID=UPI000E6D9716|nr:uncharacterized protein LOC113231909 [Hyposmocoma kahamanoa]